MTKHDIPAGVSWPPASFDGLRTGSFDKPFDTRLAPLLRVRRKRAAARALPGMRTTAAALAGKFLILSSREAAYRRNLS